MIVDVCVIKARASSSERRRGSGPLYHVAERTWILDHQLGLHWIEGHGGQAGIGCGTSVAREVSRASNLRRVHAQSRVAVRHAQAARGMRDTSVQVRVLVYRSHLEGVVTVEVCEEAGTVVLGQKPASALATSLSLRWRASIEPCGLRCRGSNQC